MLCQLSYIGSGLERETGIEPATNSLEGCDSTTELLPPTRLTCSLSSALPRVKPAGVSLAGSPVLGLPAAARSPPGERRMVAREGLEPSKPLGRQIYSLLRLTASLPRQLAVFLENDCFGCTCDREVPSTELAKGFEPPTC